MVTSGAVITSLFSFCSHSKLRWALVYMCSDCCYVACYDRIRLCFTVAGGVSRHLLYSHSTR